MGHTLRVILPIARFPCDVCFPFKVCFLPFVSVALQAVRFPLRIFSARAQRGVHRRKAVDVVAALGDVSLTVYRQGVVPRAFPNEAGIDVLGLNILFEGDVPSEVFFFRVALV